jgi:hypothetical protein
VQTILVEDRGVGCKTRKNPIANLPSTSYRYQYLGKGSFHPLFDELAYLKSSNRFDYFLILYCTLGCHKFSICMGFHGPKISSVGIWLRLKMKQAIQARQAVSRYGQAWAPVAWLSHSSWTLSLGVPLFGPFCFRSAVESPRSGRWRRYKSTLSNDKRFLVLHFYSIKNRDLRAFSQRVVQYPIMPSSEIVYPTPRRCMCFGWWITNQHCRSFAQVSSGTED